MAGFRNRRHRDRFRMDRPIMDRPVMGRPAMRRPIVDRPIMGRPAMGRPIVDRPIMGRHAIGGPIIGRPMIGDPFHQMGIAGPVGRGVTISPVHTTTSARPATSTTLPSANMRGGAPTPAATYRSAVQVGPQPDTLSTGAIVGIVIGSLFVFGCLVCLCLKVFRDRTTPAFVSAAIKGIREILMLPFRLLEGMLWLISPSRRRSREQLKSPVTHHVYPLATGGPIENFTCPAPSAPPL